MSQARVYTTAKVRKDWTCGKCGAEIKKGVDGRISFAVGFRGVERTRCTKPECYPTRSELESSAVATVYDAIDSIDWDSLTTTEDFTQARDDVAAACDEVAGEYESNEMYEINYDLQERAEMIRSAGEELSSWEPEGEEPEDEVDCEDCEGTGIETNSEDEDCTTCGGTGKVDGPEAKDDWAQEARESLAEAFDSMDLP